ncbi:MAG TPA: class I SAM-dependent methyltransferase [Chitinophagaceae bacterium]|nr:class I SAM-dependent methyltransferase [Chitinophagaceae bacterium]
MDNNKAHWENIYSSKQSNEVSWTQAVPEASLALLHDINPAKNAAVIDVGGGDSTLADFLLKEGFTNITVLDISAAALNRAKARLNGDANSITWIETDILEFIPGRCYDIWHDRAAFHFLTTTQEVEQYVKLAERSITPGGFAIIATFAENGPEKCSGLIVKRYNAQQLAEVFGKGFTIIGSVYQQHVTPFNTQQRFLFSVFKKL